MCVLSVAGSDSGGGAGIQAASMRALKNGTTLNDVLTLSGKLWTRVGIPRVYLFARLRGDAGLSLLDAYQLDGK